jgi:hypothetical protein
MAFADRIAELRPNVEIGLVQCAVGGYGIDYWAKDVRTTTLYGSCIKRAKEAAADGVVRGVVIFNGESDANPEKVKSYAKKLLRLIADLRGDLGENLSVVFTQIGPEPWGNPSFASWDEMQVIQARIAVPNAVMVSAIDLQSSGFRSPHLNTTGYVTLGRRHADAMNALLQ